MELQMKKFLNAVCFPLVLFGAIDWGLIGAFGFDIIGGLLGASLASRIVQIAIGLAAVGLLTGMFGGGAKGSKGRR
jgi:uncharacterized membrane protein YuzA (DUF378 family)